MPAESGPLEQKAELQEASDASSASIQSVAWHASSQDTVISVDESHLRHWRLSGSGAEVCLSSSCQCFCPIQHGQLSQVDSNCQYG